MMRIYKSVCKSIYIVFCCVFVFIFCDVKSEELQCSRRHILNSLDMAGPYTNSCRFGSEGQALGPSDCILWDMGDDIFRDCTNVNFSNSTGYVDGIEVLPHPDSPNFSIIFRNIQWKYMKYRMQIGDNKMCHQIQMLLNSSLELDRVLQLSFSCAVFGPWAPGEDAELFLDTGHSPQQITGHAHFVMRVPRDGALTDSSNEKISITDRIILVAVDISHKPHLVVNWPVVPEKYNVTEYRVQLGSDEPKRVVASACHGGYCSVRLFAGYSSRSDSISVQPVHEKCHKACYSYSPIIIFEFSLPVYFLVLIVLAPALVLLIIICSTYCFCCAVPNEPLEVLLLFEATEKQHCRAVRILAEYLKDVCGVRCLVDEEEIPRSESQNPYQWLHKTLEQAHAVLYVASPLPHMDMRYTEYPNVVYEALPLIQKHRTCPSHNRPGRFLVVVPPYCSEENIPKSLRDAPRFDLPQELSWLLWSIYNQHSWLPPFTWMARAYLQCCWCPGPMSAYPAQGERLEEAMRAASATHLLTEQMPHTPKDSRKTDGTYLCRTDDTSETVSNPYIHYPGNVNEMPLLGVKGSVLSGESLASKNVAIDLDALAL